MVEVHILCFNEEAILPYTMRHYAGFCGRMVLHDAFSTDRSRDIAREYGAIVRDWKTDGVNDNLARHLKTQCVKESEADWCIVVDADELIYFPEGAFYTLSAYERDDVAIVKPHGFEMVSETFPTTDGQLYDEVKMGARDDKWYAKPVLVFPRRVRAIEYSAGAHQARATLATGATWTDGAPTDPATYMLHCHHLGSVQRIGERYAAQQARHSQTNIKNRWGNFDDPFVHAQQKRNAITANLVRVIQ